MQEKKNHLTDGFVEIVYSKIFIDLYLWLILFYIIREVIQLQLFLMVLETATCMITNVPIC